MMDLNKKFIPILKNALIIVCILGFGNLFGQIKKNGTETVANSTTTNSQRNPAVAVDTSGNFIVAWESWLQDGSGYGIFARKFDQDGNQTVAEFQINKTSTYSQQSVDVTTINNGRFYVTYMSQDQASTSGGGWDCYYRGYEADGSLISSYEGRANSSTTGDQRDPAIAADTGKYFVITYTQYTDQNTSKIYSRVYQTSLAATQSPVIVDNSTSNLQGHSDVAMFKDGSYLVVWQEKGTDGSGQGVYAKKLTAGGSESIAKFKVNSTTSGNQFDPAVIAHEDGTFTITWTSYNQDGSGNGIYMQRYNADGSANGSETAVNTTTANNQEQPAITVVQDTIDVISWSSYGQDGSYTGVYMQAFLNGAKYGEENKINTRTTNFQQFAALGAHTQLVAVWQDGLNNGTASKDGDDYGISYMRYTVSDTTPPTPKCKNITVYLDDNGAVSVAGTDVDNGSTDNVGVTEWNLNKTSFACADTGSNSVILIVKDDAGNSAGCGAYVTVKDTTAPVIVTQNLTVYLDGFGNASINAADVDAGSTDNCGINTRTISQSSFTCSNLGANNITFKAKDVSGNIDSATSVVTVVDTARPSVACQNLTVYLDGSGSATITAADMDNGSSDNCGTPTLSLSKSTFTCTDAGMQNIKLYAEDASGNKDSCTAIVTVIDSVRPTAASQNLTAYLDGNGSVTLSNNAADNGSVDNCSSLTHTLSQTTFSCANVGANSVTHKVTDGAGNADSNTVTITILDSVSPTVVTQNITVYLDATGNTTITSGDIDNGSTDNCSIASYVVDSTSFNCREIGANTVKLTVTDVNGNSSTGTATVTVADTSKPSAVGQNITVYLDATGNATITAGDVDNGSTDNCGTSSFELSKSSFTCSNVGANSVTLHVSDASGNQDSAVVTVTVLDSVRPIAVCQDLTVYLDASGNATITAADVDEGSNDNCSIASLAIDSSSFTCSHIGANTVKLTATDVNGNTNTCSSTVTVLDSVSPIAVAQNLTIYLDANGNASITTGDVDNGSSDNCGIDSLILSQSSFTCNNIGSNSVTLTVKDASGNSSTATSTVTVLDSVRPTAITQNLTVYLDANGNASITTGDVNNGSSDNCGIDSLTISKSSFTCNNIGANTVTLTAKDASGNSNTATSTVTVLDSVRPTAVAQNLTVYLDSRGNVTITTGDVDNGSSDNCGIDSLTISQSSFTCNNIGANTVTLTARDASGNSSTATSTVTVLDSVRPDAIAQNLTVYLDANGNASITTGDVDNGSTDNCGVDSLTISQSSFTCNNIGNNNVTLTVKDASGNTSTATSTVTVLDSVSPLAVAQNLTVYLDANGNASITTGDVNNGSTDNCGVDSLTISKSSFTCANVGSNSVILTVKDASGNTDTASATITVIDSVRPTAVCQNLTVYLDASGNTTITPADVDNGSSDNCSVASLSIDTNSFTCANIGTNTVTLTVTDVNGNSNTCSSTVTVLDSVSPIAVAQNLTVYLDSRGNATITTGDVDNGSSDNCGIDSLILSQSSFTCNNIGSNNVTLTVKDASGNSSTATSTVTVLDSVRPTAVAQNLTVYLNANGNTSITTGDVNNGSSDNCGIDSLTISQSSFTCNNIGANTVTLTAKDASGNSSTATSTVTVLDSVSPIAAAQNLTVYLDANGNASITTGDIDNGSSDNCGIDSLTISQSSFTCNNIGANTVTLTARDASGNSSTATSTVTVLDSVSPLAVAQNLTVYLDANGNASITTGDVDNGSSDNCGVDSLILSQSSFTCNNIGSNNVTLTIKDASGNSNTATSTVTVLDSVRPTAVAQNLTVYLDANGNASITTGDVDNGSSDNCGIDSLVLSKSSFTCADIGANTVSLFVRDASGNANSTTSTVTVIDSVRPTIAGNNLTVYLNAAGYTTITTGDVNNGSADNCGIDSLTISKSSFTCANVGNNNVTLVGTDGSGNKDSVTVTVTVIDTNKTYTTARICNGASHTFGSQTLTSAGIYTETFTAIGGCDSVVVLTLSVDSVFASSSSATICSGDSVVLGSQTLKTAGTYNETFTAVNGCDSVVTLTLNVNPVYSSRDTVQLCAGETYTLGAQTLQHDGTYTETFTSINGCDSVVTIVIDKRRAKTNEISATICNQATYSFGSQTLTASGTYTERFTTQTGCDSIVTLNLTVQSYYTVDTIQVCPNESYQLGSQTLRYDGTYTETFTSINGCDSVVTIRIDRRAVKTSNVTAKICAGDSLQFGSQTLKTAGTYVETFTAATGCDSVVTLTLDVKDYSTFEVVQVCPSESYQLGSQTLRYDGIYTDTLTSIEGCDSIVTIRIDRRAVKTGTATATICSGASYQFGSQTLTSAGTYQETFTAATGCDSLVTLTLNVENYNTVDTVQLCPNETYQLGYQLLRYDGTYTETFTSINGCDSVVTIRIDRRAAKTSAVTVEICAGSNYQFGSQTLTAAGTYQETYSAASGCDSVVTLTLKVKSYNVTDTVQICPGETYTLGSQTLRYDGTYTETLSSIDGCDSVVTIVIDRRNPKLTSVSKVLCSGGSYQFGSQTLTTAGTYQETFTAAYGCDSIVTLTLEVNSFNSHDTVQICPGETYKLGSQILRYDGTYTETFTSVNGCDSVVTITIDRRGTKTTNISAEICDGDTYQLGSQNLTTAGTYQETFTAAAGCDSLVTLTLGVKSAAECGADEDIVSRVANRENAVRTASFSKGSMRIYPNPTAGAFNVSLDLVEEKSDYVVRIFNGIGQIVYQETFTAGAGVYVTDINLTGYHNGVYTVVVNSNNKQFEGRVILND